MTFKCEKRKLPKRRHRTRDIPVRTSLQNVSMTERGTERGAGPLEGERFALTARRVFQEHRIVMVSLSDPSLSTMQSLMLEEIAFQTGLKTKEKKGKSQ